MVRCPLLFCTKRLELLVVIVMLVVELLVELSWRNHRWPNGACDSPDERVVLIIRNHQNMFFLNGNHWNVRCNQQKLEFWVDFDK